MAKASNDTSISLLWENNLDTPITAANLSRLQDITTSYLDSDAKNHVENTILFTHDKKLYIKRGTIVQIINEAKDPVTKLSYVDKNSHYKLFDIGLEDLIIGVNNLDDTSIIEKTNRRWGPDLATWYVFICDKEDSGITKSIGGNSYGGGAQILISKNKAFPVGQIPGRTSGSYSTENTRLLGGFQTNNSEIIPDSLWDVAGKFQRLKAKSYYILDEVNDEYRQLEIKDLNTTVFNELQNDLQVHGDVEAINIVASDIKTDSFLSKTISASTLQVIENSDFLKNVTIQGTLDVLKQTTVDSLISNGDVWIKDSLLVMTENNADFLRVSSSALEITLDTSITGDTTINGNFINNAEEFTINIAEDTGNIKFYGYLNVYDNITVFDKNSFSNPLYIMSKESYVVRDVDLIHLEAAGTSVDSSAVTIKGQSVSIIGFETDSDKIAIKLDGTLNQKGIVFLTQNGTKLPDAINKHNALSVYNDNDDLFFSLNKETNQVKINGPIDIDVNVLNGTKIFSVKDGADVLFNSSTVNGFNIFNNLFVGELLTVDNIATFNDNIVVKGANARVEGELFIGPVYQEIFKIENNIISIGRTNTPMDVGDIRLYGNMVLLPGKTFKGKVLGDVGSYVEKWIRPVTLEFSAKYADSTQGSYVFGTAEINGDLGVLENDKYVVKVNPFEIKAESHEHRSDIFYKDDILQLFGTLSNILFDTNGDEYNKITTTGIEQGLLNFNEMIERFTSDPLQNQSMLSYIKEYHDAFDELNIFRQNLEHYVNFPVDNLDATNDTYEKNILNNRYLAYSDFMVRLSSLGMFDDSDGEDGKQKGEYLVTNNHIHSNYLKKMGDHLSSDFVQVDIYDIAGEFEYPHLFDNKGEFKRTSIVTLTDVLDKINLRLEPKSELDINSISITCVTIKEFAPDDNPDTDDVKSSIDLTCKDGFLEKNGHLFVLTETNDPYMAKNALNANEAARTIAFKNAQAFNVTTSEEFISIIQDESSIGKSYIENDKEILKDISVNIDLSSIFFDLLSGSALKTAPYIKYILTTNSGEKYTYNDTNKLKFEEVGFNLDPYNDSTQTFLDQIAADFKITIRNGNYILELEDGTIKEYVPSNQQIFNPVNLLPLNSIYISKDLGVTYDDLREPFFQLMLDNLEFNRNQYTLYYQESSGHYIWRGSRDINPDINALPLDAEPTTYYYIEDTTKHFPDTFKPYELVDDGEGVEVPNYKDSTYLNEFFIEENNKKFKLNEEVLYYDKTAETVIFRTNSIIINLETFVPLFDSSDSSILEKWYLWNPARELDQVAALNEIEAIFPGLNSNIAGNVIEYVKEYIKKHPEFQFHSEIIEYRPAYDEKHSGFFRQNYKIEIEAVNNIPTKVSVIRDGDSIEYALGNNGDIVPKQFPRGFKPEESGTSGSSYVEQYCNGIESEDVESHLEYRFNTDIVFLDSDGFIRRVERDYETGVMKQEDTKEEQVSVINENGDPEPQNRTIPLRDCYNPGTALFYPEDFEIYDENDLENNLKTWYLAHFGISIKNYNALSLNVSDNHGLFINDQNQLDYTFVNTTSPEFWFDETTNLLKLNNIKRESDRHSTVKIFNSLVIGDNLITVMDGTYAERNYYSTRVTLRLRYNGSLSNNSPTCVNIGLLNSMWSPQIATGQTIPLPCFITSENGNMVVSAMLKIDSSNIISLYPRTPYTWSIDNPIIEFTGSWLQYKEEPWARPRT